MNLRTCICQLLLSLCRDLSDLIFNSFPVLGCYGSVCFCASFYQQRLLFPLIQLFEQILHPEFGTGMLHRGLSGQVEEMEMLGTLGLILWVARAPQQQRSNCVLTRCRSRGFPPYFILLAMVAELCIALMQDPLWRFVR